MRESIGKTPLKPLQVRVAADLGRGDSVTVVAKRHDVDPSTVWRWLKKDGFCAAVAASQHETVGDAQRSFLAMRDLALGVLASVMREKPHSIAAMQAAKMVLVGCGICPEHGPKTGATVDTADKEPVILDPIGDVDPAQDEAQDIVNELTPEDAESAVAAS